MLCKNARKKTLGITLCLTFLSVGGVFAAEDAPAPWTFVSTPDFFNFDVPEPWPGWDPAVNWYLAQVKAENPEFVAVAGDLVNGHWTEGPKCIQHMGAHMYGAWIRRMEQHGLEYFTAIGDHELGDDPWPESKLGLVPQFRQTYIDHLQMPENGPEHKKGLAYYVRHKNLLFITVETFEERGGELHTSVTGKQLDWFKQVLAEYGEAAAHIVVQGHTPIYGDIKSRSSSRLMLEGGKETAFYQAMVDGGVDLYLCGEHHAVTVLESDGIWQLVHGSSWGRKVVDTQDYLVCHVYPDRLDLAMKSFPMEAKGDKMWNLHKGGGPREIVEIPPEVKVEGPQVIGTITIEKTAKGKRYTNRSGIFE
ncbi:MAG: metallophosphoesterase family protein [Candidatus Hydrogenedentota bacterium]